MKTAAPPAFFKTISEQEGLGWVPWLGRRASEGNEQTRDECQRQGWYCKEGLDPTGVAL